MLHREDQQARRAEDSKEFRKDTFPIADIVEHQRAQDDIERLIVEERESIAGRSTYAFSAFESARAAYRSAKIS